MQRGRADRISINEVVHPYNIKSRIAELVRHKAGFVNSKPVGKLEEFELWFFFEVCTFFLKKKTFIYAAYPVDAFTTFIENAVFLLS